MTDILRPVLELSVIIPGILLAYLPVKSYLRQTPLKLTAWLLPLLLGICILGGAVCCALQIPTRWFLFPLLPVIMLIYHKTLKISVWKSVSIFLAVCLMFGLLPVSALAAIPTSGSCGKNAKWSYNTATKTLTISGRGDMTDYEVDPVIGIEDAPPWNA